MKQVTNGKLGCLKIVVFYYNFSKKIVEPDIITIILSQDISYFNSCGFNYSDYNFYSFDFNCSNYFFTCLKLILIQAGVLEPFF